MSKAKFGAILLAAIFSTASLVSAGHNLTSANAKQRYDTTRMSNLESVSIDNFELDHDNMAIIVQGEVFSADSRRRASCHFVLREDGELLHSKGYLIEEGFVSLNEVPAHPGEAEFICREYRQAAFPKGLDFAFLTTNQIAKQVDAATAEELPAIIGPMGPASGIGRAHPVTLHFPQAQVHAHVRCRASLPRITVSDGQRVFGGKLPDRTTEKICRYLNADDSKGRQG